MTVTAGQNTLTAAMDNSMCKDRTASYERYYLAGAVLIS